MGDETAKARLLLRSMLRNVLSREITGISDGEFHLNVLHLDGTLLDGSRGLLQLLHTSQRQRQSSVHARQLLAPLLCPCGPCWRFVATLSFLCMNPTSDAHAAASDVPACCSAPFIPVCGESDAPHVLRGAAEERGVPLAGRNRRLFSTSKRRMGGERGAVDVEGRTNLGLGNEAAGHLDGRGCGGGGGGDGDGTGLDDGSSDLLGHVLGGRRLGVLHSVVALVGGLLGVGLDHGRGRSVGGLGVGVGHGLHRHFAKAFGSSFNDRFSGEHAHVTYSINDF
jgi:hypothetical protein